MENEMPRRRLIHTVGTMAAIAACTRDTDLFRFFVRAEASPQDRTCLAYKSYTRAEWNLLAHTSPYQVSPLKRWAFLRFKARFYPKSPGGTNDNNSS